MSVSKWIAYKEYGCYFRLNDGVMEFSPMLKDGTRDNEIGEVEVWDSRLREIKRELTNLGL